MTNRSSLARPAGFAAAIGFALAGILAAAPALAQNPPAPSGGGGTPVAKIVVVDRTTVLQYSKAGQDIMRQGQGYIQGLDKQFKGQVDGLRKEYQALQQQVAILAPDVKQRRLRDFESKQASLQKQVEAKQQQIQYGVMVARSKVGQALEPVLRGIMSERGANLLLDRQSVVLGTIDVDITRLAVQRLDQKLPKVQVQPTTPPPQVQQQMMQQQQQR